MRQHLLKVSRIGAANIMPETRQTQPKQALMTVGPTLLTQIADDEPF